MNGGLAQSRHSPMAHVSRTDSSFPTNQPHIYQQNNVVQHNGVYHQFDPARPSFQPTGTGLERYHVPRTLNVPQHHNEIVALANNHNIQQITETARLGHAQRGLAREFDDLRHNTESDIQAIKKCMMSLTSPQVAGIVHKQIEPSKSTETPTKAEADYYEYYVTGAECCPSDEMLKAHPREEIARSYLVEAEKREASAAALRKQASGLCPDMLGVQTAGRLLQIEAVPTTAAPGFACCNKDFFAIGELVEHVERTHTAPEHRLLSQTRSKAVKIRSPPNEPIASSECIYEKPLVDGKRKDESSTNSTDDQKTSSWTPAAVRNMPPVLATILENTENFSFELIRATFGGDYWSPGFYFIPKSSILPSKAYWILDATHEPFLPNKPGEHGAKLTAFFNETISGTGEGPGVENYLNVPIFIKTCGNDDYSYFGNYSQLRFSDKVSYDTIASVVPESVLRSHAEQLAETGRPAWVTQALQEHFWPKPKYEGPIPTDSALTSPTSSIQNGNSITAGQERRVLKALVEYAAELKSWEKDSKLRVNLLTADSIFKAFSEPDAVAEPGLRPFWEYLQCVGWDAGFYQMLVELKDSPMTKLEIGSTGKKRRPSPDQKDGSTAAKVGMSSEATFKLMKGKAKEVVEEYPGPEAKTKFVRHELNDTLVGSGSVQKGWWNNDFGAKGQDRMSGAPPSGPKGDLKAAREFSASVKKNGSVPPHLRGRE